MDGASKFVRGDAIAGIVITLINIIGGLFIGMVQAGMPFGEAAALFTKLTIGDGLVSQVPAFLISLGRRSVGDAKHDVDEPAERIHPPALFASGGAGRGGRVPGRF